MKIKDDNCNTGSTAYQEYFGFATETGNIFKENSQLFRYAGCRSKRDS